MNVQGNTILINGHTGEIETDLIAEALLAAKQAGNQEVLVLIDSQGGGYETAMAIGYLLQNSGLRTIGRVIGTAQSAAVLILQHCHHRQATPGTIILPHWGNATLTNSELAAIRRGDTWVVEHLRSWMSSMLDLIVSRSHQAEAAIIDLMDQERSLTAEQALALGLIDEIYTV